MMIVTIESPSSSRWLALALLTFALVSGVIACNARPTSSAAQAGDSISLTFAVEGNGFIDDSIGLVAYGGVQYDDPQRGELFIRARPDAAPATYVDFVTQYAIPGETPLRSVNGRVGLGEVVVLMVEIPEEMSPGVPVEPGTYTLELRHRAQQGSGNGVAVLPVYNPKLEILPSTLVYDYQGTQYTLESEYSRDSMVGNDWINWAYTVNKPAGNYMESMTIPDPGFLVGADYVTPPQSGDPIKSAFEMEVLYPSDRITVSAVVPDKAAKDVFWYEDAPHPSLPDTGVVTVHGYTSVPGNKIGHAWLTFKLDEGETPVTPGDFAVSLLRVADPLGVEITGGIFTEHVGAIR